MTMIAPGTVVAGSIAPVISALRWEWFRLHRRMAFRAIMGMIALAVVLILVGAVLLRNEFDDSPVAPAAFPFLIFLALTVVGPFLGIFLTAIVFSGEYGWGTLRALAARGSPRWQAASAKLLLVSIVLAVVWIVSWILSTATGLLAGEYGVASAIVPFTGETVGWGETALLFFGNVLAPIAYMSLTALLCVLGRSTTFGLAVSSAILIGESTAYPVAALIAGELYGIDIWEYLRWTLRGATSGLAGRFDETTNAWYFVPVVLAYTGLFWGLALALLSRRDLGSGNG